MIMLRYLNLKNFFSIGSKPSVTRFSYLNRYGFTSDYFQKAYVSTVDSSGCSKPYGIPIIIEKPPKNIVYIGNIAGGIAAIQRFEESRSFYESHKTKLQLILGHNWNQNISEEMDQPWGQDFDSLPPTLRKKAKSLFKADTSTRISCKQYGDLLAATLKNIQMQDRSNIEISSGVDFSRSTVTLGYFEKEGEYQPSLKIELGDITKEFPAEDTLVINNAYVYGKLTTGNHDLEDVEGNKIVFQQGTNLYTKNIAPGEQSLACVGFGLSYLWAASSLIKKNVQLICLYDKRFTPFSTVEELISANQANDWVRSLPNNLGEQLNVAAIQDCKISRNTDEDYEITLPNGVKHLVGKTIYDLTGYDYAAAVTSQLPDELVYRPSDGSIFSFADDKLRLEIDKILEDAKTLKGEDRNNFLELIDYIDALHALKEKLRPKNKKLTLDEFRNIEKDLNGRFAQVRQFVKSKKGPIEALFNRYEADAVQISYLQHVPLGSALSTYMLAAHQFGHIPHISLFETFLIRNAHVFECFANVFKEYTGYSLTPELYKMYTERLADQAKFEKNKISNIRLIERHNLFKETVVSAYPDIPIDKLDKFCHLQAANFKQSQKYLDLHNRDMPNIESMTEEEHQAYMATLNEKSGALKR